tara:strand:+ start:2122 stop:2799 length:678 start_codon:yes stop_codon:yes gene_type:complete
MLNKTQILDWASRLIDENVDNLKDPQGLITHLEGVYDVAQEVVRGVTAQYPGIPFVGEEVCLAAGLHDFGRPLRKDQMFHELRSAQYIDEHGLANGVAHSEVDVFRIAQMVRSHGPIYERWTDEGNASYREEFGNLDFCLLLPTSWQAAIVAYADLASMGGERVDPLERLEAGIRKYRDDPKYKSERMVRSLMVSKERFGILCRRVEALEQGQLTEQEIARFGFL